MLQKQILGVAAIIFGVGSSIIVWYGRPVMKLGQNPVSSFGGETSEQEEDESQETEEGSAAVITPTPAPAPVPTPSGTPGTYTLGAIALHGTRSDCWSVVNGSVYDLTTWISRHPGGPSQILGMCGIDATSAFNGQHGRSKKVQSTLGLLKIGSL